MNQHTIKSALEFSGKGLHTGKVAHIRILPAPEDHGIVFRHIDRNSEATDIKAHWDNVKTLPLCTCIAVDNTQIRTIEHLMAAFYATNIDNALIEIKGNELPILDGSALPYVKGILNTGVQQQSAKKKSIRILKEKTYTEGDRQITIYPNDEFSMDLSISLAKIGKLNWKGKVTPDIFRQEISGARTFGRFRNGLIAKIFTRFRKDPICLGADTSSALVIIGDRVLNKGGLRHPDEYIRHRILDAVGDMMLVGAPLIGRIKGNSTAHRLNHGLLVNIFSDDEAWVWDQEA